MQRGGEKGGDVSGAETRIEREWGEGKRTASAPEYPKEAVDVRVASKHWGIRRQFAKDATKRPHVDFAAVLEGTEEELGATIPLRHHFESQWADRNLERADQPKVCDFYAVPVDDQNVLRLEIAMHATPRVQLRNPLQNLQPKGTDCVARKGRVCAEVLLEVLLAVEHGHVHAAARVIEPDIKNFHNVRMPQFF